MAALTDDNNNISSFLIAIELAACEHKPGSKQIKKVPTNATIRNIFEEIHGQEKGKIDAQVSVRKKTKSVSSLWWFSETWKVVCILKQCNLQFVGCFRHSPFIWTYYYTSAKGVLNSIGLQYPCDSSRCASFDFTPHILSGCINEMKNQNFQSCMTPYIYTYI